MRRAGWKRAGLVGLAVSAGIAGGVGPGFGAGASAATGSFLETFDGAPATPQPFGADGWDVTVHSRDVDTWHALEPMHASHGAACDAPPSTHRMTAYDDAVFVCRDHVMTAINASGYGVVYLTPDRMVDFSSGEAVVRFDVSTLRTSIRDWIDVWITPYEDNLQLPLEADLPDLHGPPRNAIHVRLEQENGFRVFVYRDFQATELPGEFWRGYDQFLTPDAKRRDTFELRLSSDHLRFGMPDHDQWWVDGALPALGWDRGVVQLGHHSYTPTKDCEGGGPAGTGCGPTTWHWDNVEIQPAAPFTIIGADRRFVDAGTTGTVRFDRPAPTGAHLRFAGIGPDLQVSYDGGSTWRAAQRQRQAVAAKDEAFSSHWMALPAGVQEVRFRGSAWWGGGWMVRDASIWSPTASANPAPPAPPGPTVAPTTTTRVTTPAPTTTTRSKPAPTTSTTRLGPTPTTRPPKDRDHCPRSRVGATAGYAGIPRLSGGRSVA